MPTATPPFIGTTQPLAAPPREAAPPGKSHTLRARSFASMFFSHLLCNVRAKTCVRLHAKAGQTTPFWKQQPWEGLHTDSLCFHVYPAFPMELGSHGVFRDCTKPRSATHLPPKALCLQSYLPCRIIIHQALHFSLTKHNLTASFTNSQLLPKPGNTSTNKQTDKLLLFTEEKLKRWSSRSALVKINVVPTAPAAGTCGGVAFGP